MMKKFLVIISLLVLAACSSKEDIPDVLERNYEIKTAADSVSAVPVDFEKDNYKDLLVLYHYGFTDEEIKKYFEMPDSLYNVRVNNLFGEGLIKKNKDGQWIPTFPVIDSNDDAEILSQADSLATLVAEIVIDRMEKIRREYSAIPELSKIPFENESLMMLSGVMLGGNQLKNIERNFIKDDKPRRGNSNYYIAAFENITGSGKQPYGLYDFKIFARGDSLLCFYGSGNSYDSRSGFPVLSRNSFEKMMNISGLIAEDILNYFSTRRPILVKYYLNSGFKEDTSFREYFYWLYRLISARASEILVEKKYISFPEKPSGVIIARK